MQVLKVRIVTVRNENQIHNLLKELLKKLPFTLYNQRESRRLIAMLCLIQKFIVVLSLVLKISYSIFSCQCAGKTIRYLVSYKIIF